MKKKNCNVMFLILVLLITFSCKTPKETSMMITSSYNGDSEFLYRGICIINSDIRFELTMRKYKNIINFDNSVENTPLNKHMNYCDLFQGNEEIAKIIHLAKGKKVRLLVLAIPDKIKMNSTKVNINYKAIDFKNECRVYNLKNYYTDDLSYSGLKKMNKAAIEKIVNEIEEIINKLD